MSRKRLLFLGMLMGLILAVTPAGVRASEQEELAQNMPVAIVSQVLGQAQVKNVNGDWRPLYLLELLRPEDQIQTTDNGKVVVLFFFDNHLEVIDPTGQAKVAFKNLQSDTGSVRRAETRNRSRGQVEIPYMLLRRLRVADFTQADEPGAYEKEEVFLSAWVKATTSPPVFYCKDLQLPK